MKKLHVFKKYLGTALLSPRINDIAAPWGTCLMVFSVNWSFYFAMIN